MVKRGSGRDIGVWKEEERFSQWEEGSGLGKHRLEREKGVFKERRGSPEGIKKWIWNEKIGDIEGSMEPGRGK